MNFDNLTPNTAGGVAVGPSGTATVSSTGNAGVRQGHLFGQYAEPTVVTGAGVGFGAGGSNQPENTLDTTPYLSAGSLGGGGTITVRFTGLKTAVGLLWGSIDGFPAAGSLPANHNRLELFNGATSVGVVTGDDVDSAAGFPLLDQGRSTYVYITSTLAFDRVVATSTIPTFEFDNVAYFPGDCDPTVCVLTQGYWKTHDEWPVTSLTLGTLTGHVYSQAQLQSILETPVKGNGLISLAHQLIAAKLNAARGACVPQSVANAIAAADVLIGNLWVPPIGDGFIDPSLTSTLTGILDEYNNGGTPGGPSHCD